MFVRTCLIGALLIAPCSAGRAGKRQHQISLHESSGTADVAASVNTTEPPPIYPEVVDQAVLDEICASVDDPDKEDCGQVGTTGKECLAKGCCWDKSVPDGVPWCFGPRAKEALQTGGRNADLCVLKKSIRIMCKTKRGTPAGEETCNAAGCCWDDSAEMGKKCYTAKAGTNRVCREKGEKCDKKTWPYTSCCSGTTCKGESGQKTCQPALAEGDSCSSLDCPLGYECNSEVKQCRKLLLTNILSGATTGVGTVCKGVLCCFLPGCTGR